MELRIFLLQYEVADMLAFPHSISIRRRYTSCFILALVSTALSSPFLFRISYLLTHSFITSNCLSTLWKPPIDYSPWLWNQYFHWNFRSCVFGQLFPVIHSPVSPVLCNFIHILTLKLLSFQKFYSTLNISNCWRFFLNKQQQRIIHIWNIMEQSNQWNSKCSHY